MAQKGKKSKDITSFKKLTAFLFKDPLRRFPSSKVVFSFCAMWPYSAKGPLIKENFNLLNKMKHTYSFQK